MPPFPPSRRGQDNVRPDLMIDLSRRLAHNAYDRKSNPTGIVDMGSSVNEIIIDDLQRWLSKKLRSDDMARCKPSCPLRREEDGETGLGL